MIKMVSRMLKPKMHAPRTKGIQSNQSVKVGHRKTKNQSNIKYW